MLRNTFMQLVCNIRADIADNDYLSNITFSCCISSKLKLEDKGSNK